MAVQVREIAAMPAPEHILRRLDDFAARRLRRAEKTSNLLFGAHIIGKRDAREAAALRLNASILRQEPPGIKRQDHRTQLEKHNIALAGGRGAPAEPFIEVAGLLDVGHTKGNDVEAWLDGHLMSPGSMPMYLADLPPRRARFTRMPGRPS